MPASPAEPPRTSRHAAACLEALRGCEAAACLSLGGAFGLAHYHQYRTTNDVDAWWTESAIAADKSCVLDRVQAALQPFGTVSRREHGEVVSIELREAGQTLFSFQVARRSVQIGTTRPSPWPPVGLDSLEDLIAAKMAALIARGAPRDFLDIRELCRVGLASVAECWRLWRCREEKRGVSAPDTAIAREAVLLHLSRIEKMRPLSDIADNADRERAAATRVWFKHEFIGERHPLD
ncbi:MAG TPA: nucleotidyl transferase AbiEii/AbiGii toxin family protein [Candidatus Paceibacterota bacterium]|nr:nucleotidyl transferase AbiEii/AbiGii toxin family protein [Verrucomicrobiota bacterium]HOX04671.1 nucleotidyl transferase AbiEii/AbiGii toxin family protein [Verrucomicrobiota bacterium]HRZ47651.1 nucleotidyl transferase AbiEii/AbiGii toxin family protein [Candidatus Paceibacterota bacterium]